MLSSDPLQFRAEDPGCSLLALCAHISAVFWLSRLQLQAKLSLVSDFGTNEFALDSMPCLLA